MSRISKEELESLNRLWEEAPHELQHDTMEGRNRREFYRAVHAAFPAVKLMLDEYFSCQETLATVNKLLAGSKE